MITWKYPDTSTAIARFDLNAVHVEVTLEKHSQSWQVRFEVEGNANDVAYSALSIYDGAFDAISQFLAVREPLTVLFTTDREDLAGVYRTYLDRESKKFSALGYRVDGQHRVLRRFKPSRWSTAA